MSEGPDVLHLMADHEAAIRVLYEACADAFPSRADLFAEIAAQERTHEDMLEAMRAHGGVMSGSYSRFRPQAVTASIEFVREKAAHVRAGDLSLVEALALGKELEMALIEGNFFKLQEEAPQGLRPVLARLGAETREHARLFTTALEEERR